MMYQLRSEVYLDTYDRCYKKVIVLSPPPKHHALQKITKLINRTPLSPFQATSPCCPQDQCYYIILDPTDLCNFLCIDQIGHLFNYLLEHNFKLDTSVTRIMQKSDVRIPNLICFISKN